MFPQVTPLPVAVVGAADQPGSMTPRRSATTLVLALLVTLCSDTLCLGPPARAAGADPIGMWPLQPEPAVVRGFDPPSDPWGAGHRGVDLAGRPGEQVRSALPGRVSWVGTLAGRGVVVVDHGPTRTTYEPVAGTVSVGAQVAAGDPIGTLTVPGSHCLPRACLHWGWIEGETYLDPLRLVGAGPVRLLPLWSDAPVGLPFERWVSPLQLFTRAGEPAGTPAAAGPW